MLQLDHLQRWQSCLKTALGQFPTSHAAFCNGWGCARITVKQGQGIVDFCGVSNSFARVLFGQNDDRGADNGLKVEELLVGTTATEYGTDAPKWGVQEYGVPKKYAMCPRKEHLLAASNGAAALMLYTETRAAKTAFARRRSSTGGENYDVNAHNDATDAASSVPVMSSSGSSSSINMGDLSMQDPGLDENAQHYKTFQVYVPPIDPGYAVTFTHKEWTALATIADNIAEECGVQFRQLPTMFKYFSGKDIVEWILANLRSASSVSQLG